MLHVWNRACANHDIGAAGQHRFDEPRDVVRTVLVVRVGVHDDVRACLQAGFETDEKRPG